MHPFLRTVSVRQLGTLLESSLRGQCEECLAWTEKAKRYVSVSRFSQQYHEPLRLKSHQNNQDGLLKDCGASHPEFLSQWAWGEA